MTSGSCTLLEAWAAATVGTTLGPSVAPGFGQAYVGGSDRRSTRQHAACPHGMQQSAASLGASGSPASLALARRLARAIPARMGTRCLGVRATAGIQSPSRLPRQLSLGVAAAAPRQAALLIRRPLPESPGEPCSREQSFRARCQSGEDGSLQEPINLRNLRAVAGLPHTPQQVGSGSSGSTPRAVLSTPPSAESSPGGSQQDPLLQPLLAKGSEHSLSRVVAESVAAAQGATLADAVAVLDSPSCRPQHASSGEAAAATHPAGWQARLLAFNAGGPLSAPQRPVPVPCELLHVSQLLPPAMVRQTWSLSGFRLERKLHNGYASSVHKVPRRPCMPPPLPPAVMMVLTSHGCVQACHAAWTQSPGTRCGTWYMLGSASMPMWPLSLLALHHPAPLGLIPAPPLPRPMPPACMPCPLPNGPPAPAPPRRPCACSRSRSWCSRRTAPTCRTSSGTRSRASCRSTPACTTGTSCACTPRSRCGAVLGGAVCTERCRALGC